MRRIKHPELPSRSLTKTSYVMINTPMSIAARPDTISNTCHSLPSMLWCNWHVHLTVYFSHTPENPEAYLAPVFSRLLAFRLHDTTLHPIRPRLFFTVSCSRAPIFSVSSSPVFPDTPQRLGRSRSRHKARAVRSPRRAGPVTPCSGAGITRFSFP